MINIINEPKAVCIGLTIFTKATITRPVLFFMFCSFLVWIFDHYVYFISMDLAPLHWADSASRRLVLIVDTILSIFGHESRARFDSYTFGVD